MTGLAAQFASSLASNEADAQWLADLKARGATQFREQGLPGKRTEQWKYTSVFGLEQTEPGLGQADPSATPVAQMEPLAALAHRISMVDGALSEVEGLAVKGLSVSSLGDALADPGPELVALLESLEMDRPGQGFSALNTATLGHGLVIQVDESVDAGEILLQWNSGKAQQNSLFNSRVIILLKDNARLNLVEQYESPGEGASILNVVLQGKLSDHSTLTLTRVQQQSAASFLVSRTEVSQAQDSRFQFTGLDLGDGLARHDVKAMLEATGAECMLNAACMTRDSSHVDHHLEATHVAPDCRSSQLFRAVADDRSRVVFNGKVHVHEGADGTDAKQSSAGLLLSKLAEIDAKPELEIYADEVIAAHGATVGQLDEEALFYLRSRGVSRVEARNLLTMAFCRSVTDQLPVEVLREPLGERLTRSLAGND